MGWLWWTGGIYVPGRIGTLGGRGYRVMDSDVHLWIPTHEPFMAPRSCAARDYKVSSACGFWRWWAWLPTSEPPQVLPRGLMTSLTEVLKCVCVPQTNSANIIYGWSMSMCPYGPLDSYDAGFTAAAITPPSQPSSP